MDKKTRK